MTLAGVVIMAVALVLLRQYTALLAFGALLVIGQEVIDYFLPQQQALPSTPPTKEDE